MSIVKFLISLVISAIFSQCQIALFLRNLLTYKEQFLLGMVSRSRGDLFCFHSIKEHAFFDTQCQGAIFLGCTLSRSRFYHAQCQGANFSAAQCQGADFKKLRQSVKELMQAMTILSLSASYRQRNRAKNHAICW